MTYFRRAIVVALQQERLSADPAVVELWMLEAMPAEQLIRAPVDVFRRQVILAAIFAADGPPEAQVMAEVAS